MTKKSFATYFGLVVLAMSLFASTAFAAASGPGTGTTQVVVTNTPAQPVPMVGAIKDSDAPARKPFAWDGTVSVPQGSNGSITVTTVPPNQRLVIEEVSGWCMGMYGSVVMQVNLGNTTHLQFLPGDFANGSVLPAATPTHFYVDPGATYVFSMNDWGDTSQHTCYVNVAGYFVNLP